MPMTAKTAGYFAVFFLQAACSGQPTPGGNGDTGTDTQQAVDLCPEGKGVDNCADGWCRIEPGTFILGSPPGEPCQGMYSEDQVEVTLTRPFLIRQHEVTQAEWKALGLRNPSWDTDPEKPVVVINWFEAAAYCNALSKAEGREPCYDLSNCQGIVGALCSEYDACVPSTNPEIFTCTGELHEFADRYSCPGYRLPTSAEFEYAARAGTTTSTYNGDITTDDKYCQVDPVAEPIAWYCANSGTNDTNLKLSPVCRKQPNPWGLFDILGNASEWMDNIYTGFGLAWGEGEDGPLVDPVGANMDKYDGRRSLKSGNFLLPACALRAADHDGQLDYTRDSTTGFRPVRTLFDRGGA